MIQLHAFARAIETGEGRDWLHNSMLAELMGTCVPARISPLKMTPEHQVGTGTAQSDLMRPPALLRLEDGIDRTV